MKKSYPPESWEQEQVFKWRKLMVDKHPKLALMHSSLNGVKLHPVLAMKMKKQGMTPGVPDICLPVRDAYRKYSGLYIELKRKGCVNQVTDEQKRFIEKLQDEGFMACVCEGHNEAIESICLWLGINE